MTDASNSVFTESSTEADTARVFQNFAKLLEIMRNYIVK